jgi:cytochrome c553
MRKFPGSFFIALVAGALVTFAQAPFSPVPNPLPPPLPPVPSELPIAKPLVNPGPAAPLAPAQAGPRLPFQRLGPRQGTPYVSPKIPVRPATAYSAEEVLAWDGMNKEYNAAPGELTAHLTFAVTNISKQDVTINWVRPSCGCTVAKLPPVPWKLTPGESGNIEFSVDLRGKFGTLSKYASVDTSHGLKVLSFKLNVPAAPPGNSVVDARTKNMQMAMADRQAVFKNDCATCHVNPTVGRTGQALFQAGCAICHEAPHRATMVPDLTALKTPPTREYWKQWVMNGKPGTLMPAFSQAQGGPLTDAQIDSLVDYLTDHYPQRPVTATAAAVTPAGGH